MNIIINKLYLLEGNNCCRQKEQVEQDKGNQEFRREGADGRIKYGVRVVIVEKIALEQIPP